MDLASGHREGQAGRPTLSWPAVMAVTLRGGPTGPARSGRPDDKLRKPRRAEESQIAILRGPLRGQARMTERVPSHSLRFFARVARAPVLRPFLTGRDSSGRLVGLPLGAAGALARD